MNELRRIAVSVNNRKQTDMFLKTTRIFGAITLLSLVSATAETEADKSDVAPWRTSFDAFVKAIDDYPPNDVPYSKVEVGDVTGARVSGDAPIMKRFGGKVEFEGTFDGVITGESFLEPQKKIKKIDLTVAWPSGLTTNGYWRLHLYPKAGSLKAWSALKPKTTAKFRGVVTGITKYRPWIPGIGLCISILIEEAEPVSK
jgi:hypothetical protein